MSVLAEGFHQALYPFSVGLLLLLPVAQAMTWITILHVGFGAVFCYMALRELGSGTFGALVAALAFAFNGYLVSWMNTPSVFLTVVWLPFIFFGLMRAIHRRSWGWSIVAGIGLCLQITAGHIQFVVYSLTGLGLFVVYLSMMNWVEQRRWQAAGLPLVYLLIVVVVGSGLVAAQLLPMIELLPRGTRATTSLEDINALFSPWVLLRMVVPDIHGTDIDRNIATHYTHEVYVYFGLLPLLLLPVALVSSYRKLVWGMAGVGLLVWLITLRVPPFFQLFEMIYPGFQVFGFHRAQILIAFFWAVCAGLGADWLISVRPRRGLSFLLWLSGIILGLMTMGLLGLAYAGKYQARSAWFVPSLESFAPEPIYVMGSLGFWNCHTITGNSLDLGLETGTHS
jgi:hypothetical protein